MVHDEEQTILDFLRQEALVGHFESTTAEIASIDMLEAQGFELGKLLLEEAAEPFIKGLADAIEEAQLRKVWRRA